MAERIEFRGQDIRKNENVSPFVNIRVVCPVVIPGSKLEAHACVFSPDCQLARPPFLN